MKGEIKKKLWLAESPELIVVYKVKQKGKSPTPTVQLFIGPGVHAEELSVANTNGERFGGHFFSSAYDLKASFAIKPRWKLDSIEPL